MSVLAALTPPFLVCAVVIIAIIAFLRHEMGRGRQDGRVAQEDNSVSAATTRDDRDDGPGTGADAASSDRCGG